MVKRLPTTFGCPVELTLEVLAGKWKAVILAHLKEGALRYGELRARVPRLSDKVLTERLRDLEERGLLRRRRLQGAKSRVVYELTASGKSLRPILEALYAWGETAAPALGVKVELLSKPRAAAAS
ncbi:MAG TPA: helix-turn-helix domain-containing protein [Alphaproteobacteria bacterium]